MRDFSKLMGLIPGKQYTICGMGEFGFPYAICMIISELSLERWAQYEKTCLITFKPRGKRLKRMLRFYDIKPVIVWEGWVTPKVDMWVRQGMKDYDSGHVLVREFYPCFDQRYLKIALESVPQEPIIALWDKEKAEDITRSLCREVADA